MLLFLTVFIQDYDVRFKSEYAAGVEEMIDYFDKNISAGDGYMIYEDNYQIEICFRYYFPEFKKCDLNDMDSVKGHLYYLEVPGFEDNKKETLAHFDNAERIGDFSFDRYSFTMYRLR